MPFGGIARSAFDLIIYPAKILSTHTDSQGVKNYNTPVEHDVIISITNELP